MPRFTKSELSREFQNSPTYFRQQSERIVNESLKKDPQFDIFLSHSYLDKPEVFGLFTYLSRRGHLVYVDWIIDPNLPRNQISKKNASIIKRRMDQSDTLFHATTKNTVSSNWMPWETGYMDAKRDKCAIVEILEERYSSFASQEYLLLYPFVSREIRNANEAVMINDRDTDGKVTFHQWQKGAKP